MEKKSLIKQNILLYLEFKKVTKYDFYKKSGVSRGILDQESGITEQNINKFLDWADDCDPSWLLTGEGNMIISKTGTAQEPTVKYGKKRGKGIPLIAANALAGAGQGELVIHEYDIEQRYFIPEFSRADYLIRVKGSSMYPKYSAGDILACVKMNLNSFIQWNKTYVLDTTQGIMVKRICKGDEANMWVLKSDNKDYQDIEVKPDQDVNGISLVIGVIRLE